VTSASFRKVRRTIRREAKFAIKQMRALEQEMRSLAPIEAARPAEPAEAGETTK
jgi:hypothetical protein